MMMMSKKPNFVYPATCVICNKELKDLCDVEDGLQMVNGGVVSTIDMPYGSCFDGNIYQVGFCDVCLEELEKKNKVKLIGEYL